MTFLPNTGWTTGADEQDAMQPAEYDPNVDPQILGLTDRLNQDVLTGRVGGGFQPAVMDPSAGWQADQPADQYLQENPPFDVVNDPEVQAAMRPESPALPPHLDLSHPTVESRSAKLMRILQYGLMGGLAGAGTRTVGEGFRHGTEAINNLQQLQLKRDQAKQMAAYGQARIADLQARTAAYPAAQASANQQRAAQANHFAAQTAEAQARTDALRRGKNDAFLHSYLGSDGRQRFVFQSSSGKVYETASESPVDQRQFKPITFKDHAGANYYFDPQTRETHLLTPAPTAKAAKAPPKFFRDLEGWKNKEFLKIRNNYLLNDEEKAERMQEVQDMYGHQIVMGGGSYQPFDVRSGGASAGAAPPSAPSNGSKEIHYRIVNGQLTPE